MVVSKVRGRFAKYSGTLDLDDGDLTRSTVEATIDASSIDTGDAPARRAPALARLLRRRDVPRAPVPQHAHREGRGRSLPRHRRPHDPRRDARGVARRRIRRPGQGSVGQRADRIHREGDPRPQGLRPAAGIRCSKPAVSWSAIASTSSSKCKRSGGGREGGLTGGNVTHEKEENNVMLATQASDIRSRNRLPHARAQAAGPSPAS